jgi:REP element-mobilizing transposase RayT
MIPIPGSVIRFNFPMARLTRTVVDGPSHHVTQGGNRRGGDLSRGRRPGVCRDLLAEQTRKVGVEVWAYCLMPSHVHLTLIPTQADGPGLAVGEAHRRYTDFINARRKLDGAPLSEPACLGCHERVDLLAAVLYVYLRISRQIPEVGAGCGRPQVRFVRGA